MAGNQYYTGESVAQLVVALSQDIPALYALAQGGAGANPTASVGTAAVNGTAQTYMRSDAAPPIDVSITVTWTGVHTFNQAVTFSAASGPVWAGAHGQFGIGIGFAGGQTELLTVGANPLGIGTTGAADLNFYTASTRALNFNASTQKATFSAAVGVNGNAPPAQVAGWGTPTGGAAVSNFPGGGPATLAQCSTAIAEIIAVLKAFGLLGT